MWAAAQTPKASHQRREREENRQAEQRRQHQKGSPGIKAKIPKMIQNYRENREIQEKTANKTALRKASRRIGAVIVLAIDANATVALTNAKEA